MALWAFIGPMAAIVLKALNIFFPDSKETKERGRLKEVKKANKFIEKTKKKLKKWKKNS